MIANMAAKPHYSNYDHEFLDYWCNKIKWNTPLQNSLTKKKLKSINRKKRIQ